MQELNRSANPFPGLRTFESSETHLFFGRDGQSEELLRRLKRTRFLAVVGTSGSGKSSLVRAGLLPALQGGLMSGAGSDWRIVIMRPGGDPIGNLARAVASPTALASPDATSAEMQTVLAETTLRRSSLGLVDLVSRARTKLDGGGEPLFHDYENLLVVVDQFEELFRFKQLIEDENSKEDAAAFVKLLLEAVRQPQGKIYVVLTMRSDFLGDCSQFWGLPEAINSGQYLIPRMTRDERREAIIGPVAVGEGAISEPLVNQLLNDVGDSTDQLPIMQHALMRTWDYWLSHRRNGEPVDIPHYLAIGGMSEALSRHADEAYEELSDAQKVIAEKLFKGLTEKGVDNREIRRPMEVREICELTGADEAVVIAVIEVFRREGRSFLMPPPTDALTGVPIALNRESLIDISHESLIRNWWRLKEWTEEEAQSARIYRRLAETAVLHKAGEEALLKDPALQVDLDWREKNRPHAVWARRYHPEFEPAMSFLDASIAARNAETQEREQQHRKEVTYKRTKLIASLLAFSVLLSLASAVYAFREGATAEQQRRIAESQRVIAEQKRQEAQAQSQRADEERGKAVAASEDAKKQGRLAVAASEEATKQSERALGEKRRADEQRAFADQQAALASAQRVIAVKETERANVEALKNRQLLYPADINLAQQAYESGNVERARELLLKHTAAAGDAPGFEWYYLWHLLHSEKETMKAPAKGLISVITSPDGKTRVVGAGNAVELRRLDTGETKSAPLPGDFSIGSLAISRDGKVLAVGSATDAPGASVVLYDTETLNQLRAFRDSSESANSLVFSPDRLIVGGGNGSVSLWDFNSSQKLGEIPLEGTINLAISPDGKTFATGSSNSKMKSGAVQIWNTSTQGTAAEKPATKLWGHGASVTAAAFAPNGKTLATGSTDQTVRLWKTEGKPEDWRPKSVWSFASRVFSLAYSLDGRLLAIGCEDGSIKLCDANVRDQECITLRGHHQAVISLAFSASAEGNLLFSSDSKYIPDPEGYLGFEPGDDTRIESWDVATLTREQTPVSGIAKKIESVAYSHDGKRLAILGSPRNEVSLVDAETNEQLKPLSDQGIGFLSVAFSPDGKLIATAEADKTVRLWNASTREPIGEPLRHEESVSKLAFSPDSKLLAASERKGAVKMWDTASRKLAFGLPGGRNDDAVSVSFPPDGKSFAFYRNGNIEFWDRNLGRPLRQTKIQSSVASSEGSTALSPDGRVFASSQDDGKVVLYDTATGKELVTIKYQDYNGPSIVFSPDSKILVIGGNDGTLRLWDTASLRELLTLRGDPGMIMSAVFSPDGKKLATLDDYNRLRVWHAPIDPIETSETSARGEGP